MGKPCMLKPIKENTLRVRRKFDRTFNRLKEPRRAAPFVMGSMLLEDVEPFRLGAKERVRAGESTIEIKLVGEQRRPGGQRRFDERAGEHGELRSRRSAHTAE